MDRSLVIQQFIKKLDRKTTYVEIGVRTGDAFFTVKADHKIAIDPSFAFSRWKQFRCLVKNPSNLHNKFFEITSDHFFEKFSPTILAKGIDVAFVDGLHTYEQSLRDTMNCLRYLKDDGVVILHDCNPESADAATPLGSGDDRDNAVYRGIWNGDVWKTIAYLRATRKDLHVFVLDCDFGVGVILKTHPESTLAYSAADIDKMTYAELKKDRKTILNLKDPGYLYDFLAP